MSFCILTERAGVLVSINPQPRCTNTRNPNFSDTNYNFQVIKVQVEKSCCDVKGILQPLTYLQSRSLVIWKLWKKDLDIGTTMLSEETTLVSQSHCTRFSANHGSFLKQTTRKNHVRQLHLNVELESLLAHKKNRTPRVPKWNKCQQCIFNIQRNECKTLFFHSANNFYI